MIKEHILNIFFPPKCILCQKVLKDTQTDLCQTCREDTEDHPKPKQKISFVAGWSAMWYYKDDVRYSLLRYKFYNRRSYGAVYGKLLALHLQSRPLCDYDVLTWIPVSAKRKWFRGYDQVELIAETTGQELGTPAVSVLVKHRHNKAQSGISGYAKRKANVLGVYSIPDPSLVAGKRVLLLDDIVTTGATASECARVLLTAGAKEVFCAAVAARQ